MHSPVIPPGRWPSRRKSHPPGGWPAGQKGDEEQVGEDAGGSGRIGEERRPLDVRLAYPTLDHVSHSFLGARSVPLSHYHSERASPKRYDKRYEDHFLAERSEPPKLTLLRVSDVCMCRRNCEWILR